MAALLTVGVHLFISRNQSLPGTHSYTEFLCAVLATAIAAAAAQFSLPRLRQWMRDMCPIIAAAVSAPLCFLETITSGFRLLPMPYFPGPAAVLQSLIDDRGLLFDSTWHSLILLLGGYAVGVIIALITGICIGWFSHARYWGMPVLKVVGPIPATAWIPLAMVLSPSATLSAVGLIALAVWFPVTMLTASGISNTRASYLDVARTLGAGQGYLIFRVAVPAAMPSIFIGLFMGLGTSFLTLVVAETVGVKSGLGWYVSWAQGWAEYGKVYAALIIMAAFFSTIMTLLFKVRDRVLVWQKGVIKVVAIPANDPEASSIRAREVTKAFPAADNPDVRNVALAGVSISVDPGELVSHVGPSGCGKSTLLRLFAGLDSPDSGDLRIGVEAITGPSAQRGLVFQDPNLFPWLTVRRNIQAGLVARGMLHEKRGEVEEFMRLVGLESFANAYPHQLSGGMAQRVALVRALINHPRVLLSSTSRWALSTPSLHAHAHAG